jgi:isoquinoline 1-oxidoreductase alpha subunit
MLLAAATLLESKAPIDDAAIDQALDGHLCRCGSYPRIRLAVKRAAELRAGLKTPAGGAKGGKP